MGFFLQKLSSAGRMLVFLSNPINPNQPIHMFFPTKCGRSGKIWDIFKKISARFGEILLKIVKKLAKAHRISVIFSHFSR